MEFTDCCINHLPEQLYDRSNTTMEWGIDFFHSNVCSKHVICSTAIAYRAKDCTKTKNQALKSGVYKLYCKSHNNSSMIEMGRFFFVSYV